MPKKLTCQRTTSWYSHSHEVREMRFFALNYVLLQRMPALGDRVKEAMFYHCKISELLTEEEAMLSTSLVKLNLNSNDISSIPDYVRNHGFKLIKNCSKV